MTAFRIRNARLPQDRAAILDFIMGLQQFEQAIEPDRRVDDAVAEEFCAVLADRVAKTSGQMFIAESNDGAALGWAQAHEEQNEVYVVAEERRCVHIAELYVAEEARGRGIGRALISACEDWARGQDIKVITIGALAGNRRAFVCTVPGALRRM